MFSLILKIRERYKNWVILHCFTGCNTDYIHTLDFCSLIQVVWFWQKKSLFQNRRNLSIKGNIKNPTKFHTIAYGFTGEIPQNQQFSGLFFFFFNFNY